jgi:hypothetical protein
LLLAIPTVTRANFRGWNHTGSIWLITTPDGADLPASASLEGFPVLIRLRADQFDFSQANPDGSDLRFSTAAGEDLPYEIEEWDAKLGTASIWMRVPKITGNARQEIKVKWGNPTCAPGSNSKAVFNAANGYVSVWHMNEKIADATGTLPAKDTGTTATPGVISDARHFPGKQGIFGGDKIAGLPSGAASHSTQAWFRAEKPNATIIGWGNEGGGRGSKVRMQFRSPPHIKIDSDFSDVESKSRLSTNRWIHVVHTYSRGQGKIYINGIPDGEAKPMLDIKSPARFWIGGWYNNYDFIGDIDEVRLSSVERSADWVWLEFENQKPLQTLVGPIVQSGDAFEVSPKELTIEEGKSAIITAKAGGAQYVYWQLQDRNPDLIDCVDIATATFSVKFQAPRVSGDRDVVLRFNAIYAHEAKRAEILVHVKEAIPDPQFTLTAPPTWDGRTPIDVEVKLTNAEQMKSAGIEPKFTWDASTFAVTAESQTGKLRLLRAQNSGRLKVSVLSTNGGEQVTQSVEIAVTEPAADAWIARAAVDDERPIENQFYLRDDKGEGTLHYNGKLNQPADEAFLRVFADDKPFAEQTHKAGPDGRYAFAVRLPSGLIKYSVKFGIRREGKETVLDTVGNLVCGDAYLIDGQSNAEAVAWGKEEYPFTSPWIRTFGSTESGAQGARLVKWGDAVARGKGGVLQVGCWGMELGRRLVENQKMPICLINGAVGGTRIDQHQRNQLDPEDAATIYGRLLWRVRHAGLSHGIKAILWHQGENDQGADGPTGGFGYETYRAYFLTMAAAWKQDFPNVQHYYVFQIWPKSCAMGIDGSDNRLREVQRMLSRDFSKLSVMSTLGIDPPGGCHYPPAGYAEIARLICPLIERDMYGKASEASITPPDLKRASFNAARDSIVLEFDQPVAWNDDLKDQFYLEGERGKIASGEVVGSRLTLKLAAPSEAKTITYLDSKAWNPKMLLRGTNGIAALTFCEVSIEAKP